MTDDYIPPEHDWQPGPHWPRHLYNTAAAAICDHPGLQNLAQQWGEPQLQHRSTNTDERRRTRTRAYPTRRRPPASTVGIGTGTAGGSPEAPPANPETNP